MDAILRDIDRGLHLLAEIFRNRRIELLEVKGGRGLNAFGGTTLISQVLLAQAIDSVDSAFKGGDRKKQSQLIVSA
jgi:hypothetical protein